MTQADETERDDDRGKENSGTDEFEDQIRRNFGSLYTRLIRKRLDVVW